MKKSCVGDKKIPHDDVKRRQSRSRLKYVLSNTYIIIQRAVETERSANARKVPPKLFLHMGEFEQAS